MAVPVELPKRKLEVREPKKTTDTLRIINNVTFFGDSAIPEGDKEYNDAFETAKLLAKNGYTIINGGGPGIMKAATSGAESVSGNTKAIYWEPKLASHFEGKNISNQTDNSEAYSNYMMRTLGLIENGDIFVVFKGGTGTISEFGMVWCIAKLYYGCHKPVILFGEFWDEIIEYIQKNMYIDEVEMAVLHKANSPEEVQMLIEKFQIELSHCLTKPQNGDESSLIIGPREGDITRSTYNLIASTYHATQVGKLVAQVQLDEFISLVNPPAKILDIGCGSGMDLKYLSQRYSVKGIDSSENFVRIARFENPGCDIEHNDIVDSNIGENEYKGVWARDSIHHIKSGHLDSVFKKIFNALVPGGVFFVIVREGSGEIYESEQKTYHKLERFYHLFTPEELTERAERAGFKVERIDHEKRSHKWLIGVLKKPENN